MLEEGIEFVVDRTLRQHMGKRAFDKLKNQQNYSNPQSHHLATPQVGWYSTSVEISSLEWIKSFSMARDKQAEVTLHLPIR